MMKKKLCSDVTAFRSITTIGLGYVTVVESTKAGTMTATIYQTKLDAVLAMINSPSIGNSRVYASQDHIDALDKVEAELSILRVKINDGLLVPSTLTFGRE